jgi:hypothetical protein
MICGVNEVFSHLINRSLGVDHIVAIVRNKTIFFRIDILPALKDKDFYLPKQI